MLSRRVEFSFVKYLIYDQWEIYSISQAVEGTHINSWSCSKGVVLGPTSLLTVKRLFWCHRYCLVVRSIISCKYCDLMNKYPRPINSTGLPSLRNCIRVKVEQYDASGRASFEYFTSDGSGRMARNSRDKTIRFLQHPFHRKYLSPMVWIARRYSYVFRLGNVVLILLQYLKLSCAS